MFASGADTRLRTPTHGNSVAFDSFSVSLFTLQYHLLFPIVPRFLHLTSAAPTAYASQRLIGRSQTRLQASRTLCKPEPHADITRSFSRHAGPMYLIPYSFTLPLSNIQRTWSFSLSTIPLHPPLWREVSYHKVMSCYFRKGRLKLERASPFCHQQGFSYV